MSTNFKQMKKLLLLSIIVLCGFMVKAQESDYEFKTIIDLGVPSVKSQGSTGTCWCFSTVSFLESELLRMGKPEYDLAEMYIVKKAYEQKAVNYIKTHGKSNFSEGGQAHDVMNEIIDHGIVPESVFNGIKYNSERHSHGELSTVLSYFLNGVLEARRPTTVWFDAYKAILDVYLGKDPESFKYNGKTYTPKSFSAELGINPDDYVEITSYTDMPYYEASVLLVPDNWSYDKYYNVKLDEIIEIMNNSLKQGYTFVWDGDMSDKGFSHKNDIAVIVDKNDKERKYLKTPTKEKHIDADFRQSEYNNFDVTDDHLMHIVGLVKDQNGVAYYKTKNSWGAKSNKFGGFLNMSEEYVRLHTIAIMVHKDVIPKELKKKLNIK